MKTAALQGGDGFRKSQHQPAEITGTTAPMQYVAPAAYAATTHSNPLHRHPPTACHQRAIALRVAGAALGEHHAAPLLAQASVWDRRAIAGGVR